MLSKLLKHEFRATARVMVVFFIILFGGALFTLLTNLVLNGREILFLSLLNGLVCGLFVTALVASPVVAVVLAINRFHKNLMTDEGYLMFTLPASEHQLIFSKMIVSLVWFIAALVADVLACILAFFRLADYKQLWALLLDVLSRVHIASADVTGYCVELVLIFLLGSVAACLMVYGAIALGYSFANKKGLLSVAFFFLFSIGIQVLATVGVGVAARIAPLDTMSTAATTHLLLCLVLAFIIVMGAGFYLLTYEMLHRRLNLQ